MKVVRWNDDGSALVQMSAEEVDEWDLARSRWDEVAAMSKLAVQTQTKQDQA